MDVLRGFPDYTLETALIDNRKDCKNPEIVQEISLEVESADVRCLKGDCNQDYAPG